MTQLAALSIELGINVFLGKLSALVLGANFELSPSPLVLGAGGELSTNGLAIGMDALNLGQVAGVATSANYSGLMAMSVGVVLVTMGVLLSQTLLNVGGINKSVE